LASVSNPRVSFFASMDIQYNLFDSRNEKARSLFE